MLHMSQLQKGVVSEALLNGSIRRGGLAEVLSKDDAAITGPILVGEFVVGCPEALRARDGEKHL